MKKLLFVTIFLLFVGFTSSVNAANVSFSITANSGSQDPNSGNFSPSSINVNQGDNVTITFSVPGGDPYCCGAQVKGNGGEFDTGTIMPGQSAQVNFIANSSFIFTSYWPQTQTVKAQGTVNVATPSPPDIPTGLVATPISTTQIHLSWNSASGAIEYEVYRNDQLIATVATISYASNGLSPSTLYTYKVRSKNGTLFSSFTPNVQASTMNSQVPSPTPTLSVSPTQSQPGSTISPTVQTSPTLIPTIPDNGFQNGDIYVDAKQEFLYINGVAWGYGYHADALPSIDSKSTVLVTGRTIAGANIALNISGITTVNTISNDDGFWTASINPGLLQIGANYFEITIRDIPRNLVAVKPKVEFNVTQSVQTGSDNNNNNGQNNDDSDNEQSQTENFLYDTNITLVIYTAFVTVISGGLYLYNKEKQSRTA